MSTSPFNWQGQPRQTSLRKLDQAKRIQMGTSRAAWARGTAGNYLVRAIDMRTAPSFKRAE